jgi:hypothetical protein
MSITPALTTRYDSDSPLSPAHKVPDALLWQYYLCHTSKTLAAAGTNPSHAEMWQNAVPAVAFNNAPAAHAMMALTALDLGSTEGAMDFSGYDYLATASMHYTTAIERLRTSIKSIENMNADAMLACSMILIPCGLAFAQRQGGCTAVREWIPHLRGFRSVGNAITAESPQRAVDYRLIPFPQMGIPPPSFHTPSNGDEAPSGAPLLLFHSLQRGRKAALEDLMFSIEDVNGDQDDFDAEPYVKAVVELEYVMDFFLECNVTNFFRAIFTWPIQVPLSFVKLLSREDELALAIYAHWLVATLMLDEHWWLREFGSVQIERISALLVRENSPHAHLLRWPRKMLDEWRAICTLTRDWETPEITF